jgi:hypothetical protein
MSKARSSEKRLSSGQISRQLVRSTDSAGNIAWALVGVLDGAVQSQDPGAVLAGVQDIERAVTALITGGLAVHCAGDPSSTSGRSAISSCLVEKTLKSPSKLGHFGVSRKMGLYIDM